MKKFACTECTYVFRPAFGEEDLAIEPGTPFESVRDDFSCPSCGAGEDVFYAIEEHVNDPTSLKDPSEAELCHIPTFRFENGGTTVEIGTEDIRHPDEGDHFIEWVALFDEDGEAIETVYHPTTLESVFFDGFEEGDFAEVRAACTLHGIWRWFPQGTFVLE